MKLFLSPFFNKTTLLLVAIVSFSTLQVNAQQRAFPTAEGAGAFVTGGRGTTTIPSTIFEVTKLTDDGSVGTLRWALTNNSPTATYRTVVFRVSGTIHLTSELKFTRANTTVAGQTAPGDGICIADYPVSFSQDNIIVRYIRFRMGDKNTLKTNPAGCGVPTEPFSTSPSCLPVDGSGGDDAFGGTYRNNIIIDHCTMSWSSDEACSIYGGTNTTLQWNIFSEPLNHSYHFETGDVVFENHGYGGIQGGVNMSIHHNLYAHIQGRVPRFDGSRNLGNGSTAGLENADFRNNVLYNWGAYNTNGGEGGNYNIVNNYYKYGPSTSSSSSIRYQVVNPYKDLPSLPYGKYYLSGNYVDGSTTNTANNWRGALMNGGSAVDTTSAKVTTPFNIATVNTNTASQAYDYVLSNAGASLPKRDTLDQRIVNDVKNRTGKIIDVQGGYPHATPYAATVNAWPALNAITAPTDTDHDGMPDVWEARRGLNANLATDRNLYNINGYSNLENYLNGDSIVAVGTSNSCISSKVINAGGTNSWLDAKDSSYSILISTDTMNVFASLQNNGNLGAVNASYYVTNTTRFFNAKPYLNRNITITPSGAPSAAVTVRLYFTATEFNALKTADLTVTTLSNLRVYRTNQTACATTLSSSYVEEVIIPTSSDVWGTYQTGYYVEFSTSSFGTFYIAGTGFAVPQKLLSFNAIKDKDVVNVKWTTTNEIDMDKYLVERSVTGNDFTSIASIQAKNKTALNAYDFIDYKPLSSVSYYRLKMIDKDGTFTYSSIIKLPFYESSKLEVYPNPAKDNIVVTHEKAKSGCSISLYTIEGKVIATYKVEKGTEKTLINLANIITGNYLLVFNNTSSKSVKKLVKL